MWIEKNLPQEAIAFHSYEDAAAVEKILIENGYCTMMSREEHLWLLNWCWTEVPADRNGVIFIDRALYECDMYEWQKRHSEMRKEEIK